MASFREGRISAGMTGVTPRVFAVIPAKAALSSYNELINRRNHWIVGSPFVPSYVPFLADVDGLLRTLAHVALRFLHPMLDVDPLQSPGHSSVFARVPAIG